jgi:hypothetical protein
LAHALSAQYGYLIKYQVSLALKPPIKVGVIFYPEPDHPISVHGCNGSVAEADSRGVNPFFAFKLLELQAGMKWIALKRSVGSLRLLPHINW